MSTIITSGSLLTVSETAERLRVSEKTVRRLIERRELPAFRVGGSIRLDAGELDQWIGLHRMPLGGGEAA
jgi:excisionase family DNA binding protein